MNGLLFGKELFLRFTVRAFLDCLSICVVFVLFYFFGFKGGVWDLIYLSFYLLCKRCQIGHIISNNFHYALKQVFPSDVQYLMN